MLIAGLDFTYKDTATGKITQYRGPFLANDVWQEADKITDPDIIASILSDDVLHTYVLELE